MRAENISRFIDVHHSAGGLAIDRRYLDRELRMRTIRCSMSSHCSADSDCRRLV